MTSSSTKFAKLKSERAAKTFVKFSHFVLQFCKFLKSYCCLSSPGKNGDNFGNTICNHADHNNHHFQSISYFKFRYERWRGLNTFPTTAFIFPVLQITSHKTRHFWGSLAPNILWLHLNWFRQGWRSSKIQHTPFLKTLKMISYIL